MVVNDFLPSKVSGVEQYVFELSSALVQQGHDVRILYTRTVNDKTVPLAPIHDYFQDLPTIQMPVRIDELGHNNNTRIRHMLRHVLHRERPEIIHLHSFQGFSFAVLDAAYQAGIPTVYTAHDFSFLCANSILQDAYGKLCSGPTSANKCSRCIQTIRRMQQLPPLKRPLRDMQHRTELAKKHFSLLDFVRYPSDFSRNLHHEFGLRTSRENRADLGMRLPDAQQPPKRRSRTVRFTYLGGICHVKGLDIAVNAFNMADTRQAVLQIYGSINNPIYFNGIKFLVKPEKRVTYYGRYSKGNLRLIFSQTDVLVLPSRMETFSFVAREALSHGIPVIAARSGALPEVVIHGHNGLLFNPAQPSELADIFTLLSQDPNLVHALRSGIGPVRSIEDDATDTAETYASLAASEKTMRFYRPDAPFALRQHQ